MSYEPTNWKSGDTVTSAKLNKIEQGIANAGGGSLVVTASNEGVLDHTWKEISDAGFAVLYRGIIVCYLVQVSTNYGVVFLDLSTNTPYVFVADSEDGYPVIQQQG